MFSSLSITTKLEMSAALDLKCFRADDVAAIGDSRTVRIDRIVFVTLCAPL
jgi:hypothetical protein